MSFIINALIYPLQTSFCHIYTGCCFRPAVCAVDDICTLISACAYGTTGLVVAAFTRFTATLNSFAGFYNLQLYFNQYFKEGFLGYLTADNQNTDRPFKQPTGRFMHQKGFTSDQASGLANAAIWQNLHSKANY
jgi:DHA2 family multidrug resistance protein